MSTRVSGVPTLELYTDLACLNGVGLPVGMSMDADTWTINESESSPESMVFTTPRFSDAGLNVAEAQIARVTRADDDFDEMDVAALTFKRGADAMATVTCRPLIYRFTDCGIVDDWTAQPANGLPVLDWGWSQLTAREGLQSRCFDNPNFATELFPFVLGDIDPEDVLIDIDVSWPTVQQVFDAVLTALSNKTGGQTQYWIPPLERIGGGDNRYYVHIKEVAS
jgi:hypothetical protein